MNRRTVKKKSQLTLRSGIFWGAILLVTIAFLALVIVKWVDSSKVVTSYDRMEQVVGSQVFKNVDTKTDGEFYYYVFVYGSDKNEVYSERVSDLEKNVCAYLTYVNKNAKEEDAIKLYGFDICNSENEGKVGANNFKESNYALFSISKDSTPVLLKVKAVVKEGKVTATISNAWDNVGAIKAVLSVTK